MYGFTYSASKPYTKNKERAIKYKNQIDRRFKLHLPKRTRQSLLST